MSIFGLFQGDPWCLPTQNWLKTPLRISQFRNFTMSWHTISHTYLGESISVDIYKSSAIILIVASSIIVITSFLGCCGAIKVTITQNIDKVRP